MRDDQPKLAKMPPQGVDKLSALPDNGLVRSEGDRTRLVFGALYRHVMQVRTQGGFSDRGRVRRIVLPSLDKRLHGNRRDKPYLGPKLCANRPQKWLVAYASVATMHGACLRKTVSSIARETIRLNRTALPGAVA